MLEEIMQGIVKVLPKWTKGVVKEIHPYMMEIRTEDNLRITFEEMGNIRSEIQPIYWDENGKGYRKDGEPPMRNFPIVWMNIYCLENDRHVVGFGIQFTPIPIRPTYDAYKSVRRDFIYWVNGIRKGDVRRDGKPHEDFVKAMAEKGAR